jgi:seryl-tRNA synthetase
VAYHATMERKREDARIDRILEVDELWQEIGQHEARLRRQRRDIMARMAQLMTDESRHAALAARLYAVAAREARREGYAAGAAEMAG